MTKPSGARAIMADRHEDPSGLDYFPTPRWATRSLCEKLKQFYPIDGQSCWEPACGEGYMSETLKEYFGSVYASDIKDYEAPSGVQDAVASFTCPLFHPPEMRDNPPDWIITNPPFNAATDFIRIARSFARVGYAMFVRTAFLEGMGRYKEIYAQFPPRFCWVFSPRVTLVKGRIDPEIFSKTSYAWLVWIKGLRTAPELGWFPKKDLCFDGDEIRPGRAAVLTGAA